MPIPHTWSALKRLGIAVAVSACRQRRTLVPTTKLRFSWEYRDDGEEKRRGGFMIAHTLIQRVLAELLYINFVVLVLIFGSRGVVARSGISVVLQGRSIPSCLLEDLSSGEALRRKVPDARQCLETISHAARACLKPWRSRMVSSKADRTSSTSTRLRLTRTALGGRSFSLGNRTSASLAA
jgi:hypothetical protein